MINCFLQTYLKPYTKLFGLSCGSDDKESACSVGDPALMPSQKDSLEKEILWTEKPGGLQPMGHKEFLTTKQLTPSLSLFH